jgi:hypothetical protein
VDSKRITGERIFRERCDMVWAPVAVGSRKSCKEQRATCLFLK